MGPTQRGAMLKARILTALCLLAAFLSALFLLSPQAWLVFAVLVAWIAAWEWGGLVGWSGVWRASYPVLAGILVAALGAVTGLASTGVARHPILTGVYLASAAFWLAWVPLWLSRKWRIKRIAAGVATGLMVVVPASLALAHARQVSPAFLLACMAAVWLADIAAYFVGRAIGRHKLAPAISPGKSWEGAIGGAVAVTIYGLGLLLSRGSLTPAGLATATAALLAFTALSVGVDADRCSTQVETNGLARSLTADAKPRDLAQAAGIVVGIADCGRRSIVGTPTESTLYDRKVMRTVATGSTLGALAGAAAVVLAILGLADIEPHYMLAIAAIVVGAALLAQAGFVAAEASTIAGAEQLGRTGKAEFEGGISAEALAGGAAIVLGILALVGFSPMVLNLVALLAIGAAILLGGAALGGRAVSLRSSH